MLSNGYTTSRDNPDDTAPLKRINVDESLAREEVIFS